MFTGDTMFLSHFCGHMGPRSKKPCFSCEIDLADLGLKGIDKKILLQRKYKARDLNKISQNLSMVQPPLFSIDRENIMPPPLHTPLGVVTDLYHQIENMCRSADLRDFFRIETETVNATSIRNDLSKFLIFPLKIFSKKNLEIIRLNILLVI